MAPALGAPTEMLSHGSPGSAGKWSSCHARRLTDRGCGVQGGPAAPIRSEPGGSMLLSSELA